MPRSVLQPLCQFAPSIIVLHRFLSHIIFGEYFDYWASDLDFEVHLCWQAWAIFPGYINLELFSVPQLQRPIMMVRSGRIAKERLHSFTFEIRHQQSFCIIMGILQGDLLVKICFGALGCWNLLFVLSFCSSGCDVSAIVRLFLAKVAR